ncbi:MAG TPA: glycoside hydrolase family 13 protein [Cellvibrio sp.]|nr:glycoside hydrolase family 13 protein [Cellvibrio sp.]
MRIIAGVLAALLAANISAKEFEVQHLEPLNWWVGMHNSDLQLMVHGENISASTPSINYPGVTLVGVEKTDNKNYLFINLRIAESTKPGTFKLAFSLDGKEVSSANYRLDARLKGSAERKSFSAKDAIYLLVPDRFANGNPANDSHKDLLEGLDRSKSGGRHGGDIKGVIDNLDYIAGMGFTMIWPTPFIQNDQKEYSYHGYSDTNHYQIDARFGSNEDYKNLVAVAQKKGMGIIQDIVLNHIGSGHWWMKDLPAKDWVNFPDKYVETTHRRTTLHDIHVAADDREDFASGWFVNTMPDLNQRNPFLATYLIQNTIWWVEYANIAGIREDTYSYSDKAFLAVWSKAILDEYPNFNIVGEEWSPNTAIVSSWQKGKVNTNGYVSSLPSLMDFPTNYATLEAFTPPEGFDTGFVRLYESLANDFQYADPMKLVIFPENHDTPRIFSILNEDLNLYKNVMVYFSTLRGIPQFFYGSEVLMKSPKTRDDGVVRSDMPGGWAGDKVNAFTGKGLSAEQKEAQSYLKFLLNWRKANSVIHEGKLMHYVPRNGTYVYFRYSDNKKVMVVLNKNAKDSSLDLTRFHEMLNGKVQGKEIFSKSVIDLTKPLELKAMTPVIIEL